ncbi:MAG: FecR domain-containing protein [Hyphomicrobiales bacterium]|nr:FecR domain-containing protein [Hyphomicrobiales bacterium]
MGVGAWGSGALGIEALAANGASHAVAGQVAAIRGAATATSRVQSRTLSRALQLQDKVFVQDLLATSRQSRLNVKLGAATQLYMGENTRVVIDDQLVKRGGDIRLSSGALLFQREAPDPKPGVTINSPFALLAVRGTTVFAGPSNGVFGVFVVDGEVQVRAAGASVVLKPGEGTNIQRVGARPTAAAAWGKARIEAALASVR